MATVHLWITGKVQGVFYRATAAEHARKLHLNGWIKNTGEGAVEATVSGPDEAVEKFIAWCRQGPARAGGKRGGDAKARRWFSRLPGDPIKKAPKGFGALQL